MNKCEHLIGRLNREDVFDTDNHDGLREMLKAKSGVLRSLKEWGINGGQILTPREIADARRGFLHRYTFCPYCGIELNWKQLIDEATK
jgi:hypothetical protein